MLRQLRRRWSLHIGPTEDQSRTPSCQCDFKEAQTALIVHGLHKSATMFLYQFFADVCSRLDIPLHSIHNQPADHNSIADSINTSFVLCPVRSFDTAGFEYRSLFQTRHLFQVRDPRDVLVSEYFSIGWRHTTEGWSKEELARRKFIRSLSADEYVLQEPEIATASSKASLLDRCNVLVRALADPGAGKSHQVVKYETMVTDFESWLRQTIRCLNIDPEQPQNQKFIRFLADRYEKEFLPDPDDAGHKRNVTPGDHRNQLQSDTIEKLNERFSVVLDALGYR